MLMRTKTHEMMMLLAKMEAHLLHQAPDAPVASEALLGIERQLQMALPRHAPERKFLSQRGLSASFNRMVALLMVTFGNRPGPTGFDGLRQAVVAAANSERDRLDVLVEAHQWLESGCEPDAIRSQLEDRFAGQGLKVIREPEPGKPKDERFRYHGKGSVVVVRSPAYCVTKMDGAVPLVRQGDIELIEPPTETEQGPEAGERVVELHEDGPMEPAIEAEGESAPPASDDTSSEREPASVEEEEVPNETTVGTGPTEPGPEPDEATEGGQQS